ncbi:MAG TPA: polyprenyl synthetase family protein [Ktedonobacteraceae bacterium]
MTTTPGIQTTLLRYQPEILQAMQQALQRGKTNSPSTQANDLAPFYGQMQYHLGWVDKDFMPTRNNAGKLLRPMLLLLAYEAAGAWGLDMHDGAHLGRALPATTSLELVHNFSLIHDDIVDGDTERRHRPTLWSLWGLSQGINTGDGMFALARLALWDSLAVGVEGQIAARLAAILDRASLTIAEGQYLDLSFEQLPRISVAMYLDMIGRKTAALMSAAAEMGGILGTREETTIASLSDFGFEIGLAFQVRDDVLGVWASSAELGKTSAGDIYRCKKSLPALHALEHASAEDQQGLRELYTRQTPLTEAQVANVLAIFARSGTHDYCLSYLSQQCLRARQALGRIPPLADPTAIRALADMETLLRFIESAVQA